MRLVNVGYSNLIPVERIVSIEFYPYWGDDGFRRVYDELEKESLVLKLTMGRKIQSVIVMDSGHIILSALSPAVIQERIGHDAT